MDNNPLWVIETKHIDPNDFYVKVDGSPFYTAYWVARSADKKGVELLLINVISDLVLGKHEVISISHPDVNFVVGNSEINSRVNDGFGMLSGAEDIQLAAWITVKGGLW